MYNVELYNWTTRRVVESRTAKTEEEAGRIALEFIGKAKAAGIVIKESCYQMSPRGFVFGQMICTAAGVFDISTASF